MHERVTRFSALLTCVLLCACNASTRADRDPKARDLCAEPASDFRVRVVDGRSGEPIARAELVLETMPPDDGSDWPQTVARARDFEQLVADLAAEFQPLEVDAGRTDAQGWTTLASPRHDSFVEARAGELYGSMSVDAGFRGEVVVSLRPDQSAWLRLLDATGRPVEGALVYLRRYEPPSSEDLARESGKAFPLAPPPLEFPASMVSIWQGNTRADGAARIEHVQDLLRRPENHVGLEASVSLPGLEGTATRIDASTLAGSTITLTLPEHSRVSVRLVRADGQPVPLGSRVSLEVAEDASTDVTGVGEVRIPSTYFLELTRDGRAVFGRVAAGVPLVLTGVIDGLPHVEREAVAPGPGEGLELTLVL